MFKTRKNLPPKLLHQPLDPSMVFQVIAQKAIDLHHPLTLNQICDYQYLFTLLYVAKTNNYPFANNIKFECYDYGPIIIDVYHEFDHIGNIGPITDANRDIVIQNKDKSFNLKTIQPTWYKLDSTMNQIIDTFMPKLINLNIYDVLQIWSHDYKSKIKQQLIIDRQNIKQQSIPKIN